MLPFCLLHAGGAARVHGAVPTELARVARRVLLPAHVRRHRRLSPLLQSSLVQAQPLLAVLPRVPRADLGAEGRALVGGASPRSSSELRSQGRPALARARGLLVVAPRLDPVGRVRRLRSARIADFASSPSCAGSTTSICVPTVIYARRDLSDRRLGRVRLGLPRRDRRALPRHVPDQLARAHLGHAPLRDARREPQQLLARASSRSARAGTTTTTTTCRASARASAGGKSTSPTTCSACSRGSASRATCASSSRIAAVACAGTAIPAQRVPERRRQNQRQRPARSSRVPSSTRLAFRYES